jgi:hypothetical protein
MNASMSFSFVAFSWTRLPCYWSTIDEAAGYNLANFELRNLSYKDKMDDEIKSLNNVARDMALFMTAVDIFYCFEDGINDFSWIASSDSTVGLILQEICIAEIDSKEKRSKKGFLYTRNIAKVGLRPTGISHKQLESIISKYPPIEEESGLSLEDSISIKKSRLSLFAKKLLNSKYQEHTST